MRGGLRAVLAAVREAAPGTGMADIARDLGLSRDEVEAMIEYWVQRGALTTESLRGCSTGCSTARGAGCGGCPLAAGAPSKGPALTLIGLPARPGHPRP